MSVCTPEQCEVFHLLRELLICHHIATQVSRGHEEKSILMMRKMKMNSSKCLLIFSLLPPNQILCPEKLASQVSSAVFSYMR